ncbi:MAG: L-seryl-tRNA(Sec) selenium transferase, partial [Candidatus Cloacimonetes bacterium]|nr:L-seryl-tRNA(Sec) selenium transferase [Candidatus Cloacimonadota bacterium]
MIRKLTLNDKNEILRITKDIWEGEDYIPFLIDRWLEDEAAVLAGYFEQETLIGFGRMSFITPGNIWMEGLRKDPAYEGKGITNKLAEFFFAELLKIPKIDSVRFITYYDNVQSIKANEHLGFVLQKSFSFKEYNINKRKKTFPKNIVRVDDIDYILERIKSSNYLKQADNDVVKGWKSAYLEKTWIETILKDGVFFEYRESGIVKGFVFVGMADYEPALWISMIEYQTQGELAQLIKAVECFGQDKKIYEIQTALPKGKYRADMNKIGFKSWEKEDDFLLYNLPAEILEKLRNEGKMTDLRKIPSVSKLLNEPEIKALIKIYGSDYVTALIRHSLDNVRADCSRGGVVPALKELIGSIENILIEQEKPSLKTVINATGIIIHTNLGRAPLGMKVYEEMKPIFENYCNLEFDLKDGSRGHRMEHIRDLICMLTGAEDAILVNNNASAVYMILNVLAKDKEVLVSRGELVEIGGSFRIPDIMEASGAKMVEVGTTNRTHLKDYANNLNENTALIFRAHPSNYK